MPLIVMLSLFRPKSIGTVQPFYMGWINSKISPKKVLARDLPLTLHSARIGLYCGVTFVEFQCCPFEIFAVKTPQFFQHCILLRDMVND